MRTGAGARPYKIVQQAPDAEPGRVRDVNVTLDGSGDAIVPIADGARGFRLKPDTDALRWAIDETPETLAASSDPWAVKPSIGNGAAADEFTSFRLFKTGSKEIRLAGANGGTCLIEFF